MSLFVFICLYLSVFVFICLYLSLFVFILSRFVKFWLSCLQNLYKSKSPISRSPQPVNDIQCVFVCVCVCVPVYMFVHMRAQCRNLHAQSRIDA